MSKRDYKYQQIIRDGLGKEYLKCIYCKKYKKKECRLKIEEGKCVNEI